MRLFIYKLLNLNNNLKLSLENLLIFKYNMPNMFKIFKYAKSCKFGKISNIQHPTFYVLIACNYTMKRI